MKALNYIEEVMSENERLKLELRKAKEDYDDLPFAQRVADRLIETLSRLDRAEEEARFYKMLWEQSLKREGERKDARWFRTDAIVDQKNL